jgi:hypothetical protein
MNSHIGTETASAVHSLGYHSAPNNICGESKVVGNHNIGKHDKWAKAHYPID